MRLQVHQPASESPSGKGKTRVIVSDISNSYGIHPQNNNGDLSTDCSRLQVKMEIHPISNTNYFHIVLQLIFMTNAGAASFEEFGFESQNPTTDAVELLFLAELRRPSKYNDEPHQRSRSNDCTTQTPPPSGKGALVELTVGSELFVINVFAEEKPRSKEDGVREEQSLGLCHRVVVNVSKQSPEEEGTSTTRKRPADVVARNDACGGNTTPKLNASGGWLRKLRPQRVQRVVTEGSDPLDSDPGQTSDPRTGDSVASASSTEVCLQSWSVKTIPSNEGMLSSSAAAAEDNFKEQRGTEATLVAFGKKNSSVSRGLLLNF